MSYYKWFLVLAIIAIVLMYAYPRVAAHAQVEVSSTSWTVQPTLGERVMPLKPSIPALISHYSEVYGVSSTTLYSVLKCESKLNPDAIGDSGASYGVAQIHLSSHPGVTKAQALDPAWAIEWTAKQLNLGRGYMWTCYNLLYGDGI